MAFNPQVSYRGGEHLMQGFRGLSRGLDKGLDVRRDRQEKRREEEKLMQTSSKTFDFLQKQGYLEEDLDPMELNARQKHEYVQGLMGAAKIGREIESGRPWEPTLIDLDGDGMGDMVMTSRNSGQWIGGQGQNEIPVDALMGMPGLVRDPETGAVGRFNPRTMMYGDWRLPRQEKRQYYQDGTSDVIEPGEDVSKLAEYNESLMSQLSGIHAMRGQGGGLRMPGYEANAASAPPNNPSLSPHPLDESIRLPQHLFEPVERHLNMPGYKTNAASSSPGIKSFETVEAALAAGLPSGTEVMVGNRRARIE